MENIKVMREYEDLLAALDLDNRRPECHAANAAIRALAAQLEAERRKVFELQGWQQIAETAQVTMQVQQSNFDIQHSTWKQRAEAAEAKLAQVERETIERCEKVLNITLDQIRLIAGEMTAGEMRTVNAVLINRMGTIRALKTESAAPQDADTDRKSTR